MTKRPVFGEDLFANPEFDAARYAADLAGKPVPPRTFGILFTPRSGSSWLTDVLTRTGLLGKPQEWFNPNFVPGIARALNARDAESYMEMLRRKQKRGGHFSFEITLYQMRRTFGGEAAFMALLPEKTRFFYLARQDMVAQAVSLAKAVKTEVFHAAQSSGEEIAAADAAFAYDARDIRHWLEHIFELEKRTEAFIAGLDRPVERLTYEEITGAGAEATARRFLVSLRPAKGASVPLPEMRTGHRKIGSGRNEDYAARFRAEHPALIDEIAAFRAGLGAAAPSGPA